MKAGEIVLLAGVVRIAVGVQRREASVGLSDNRDVIAYMGPELVLPKGCRRFG